MGALLPLAFALGRTIPVAAGASVVGWAKRRPGLAVYRRGFEIAGGLVLVASELYMLNAYFFWWPTLAIRFRPRQHHWQMPRLWTVKA